MNDNEPNTFSAIGLHAALILNRLRNERHVKENNAKHDDDRTEDHASKEDMGAGLKFRIGAR